MLIDHLHHLYLVMIALMLAWGLFALFMIKKYLIICGLDEAVVRMGTGGIRVAIQKSLFSFPLIHKFQRVSLRTIKFHIQGGHATSQEPLADNGDQGSAMVTQQQESLVQIGILQDRELAPILLEADIYIHIPPREDHIIRATQTFGENLDPQHWEPIVNQVTGIHQESLLIQTIRAFTTDKMGAAIQAKVASMTLEEINSSRQVFTDHVTAQLNQDFKNHGLAVESITIKSVDKAAI